MRIYGTVKWFKNERGFGFIAPDGGASDVFVHYTSIRNADGSGYRTLLKGQRVTFEIVERDKGRAASDVELIPQREIRREREPATASPYRDTSE